MKNIEQFKITYDHKENCGAHFAIRINSAKSEANACSCGHIENGDNLERRCSKCNTNIYSSIYKGYTYYHNGENCEIESEKTHTGYYCDKIEFTNDGGFIEIKKIKVRYAYAYVKQHGSLIEYLHSCNIEEMPEENIRIEIFYKTNKRSKKITCQGIIRKGDSEEKLLKTKISELNFLGWDIDIKAKLTPLCLEYAYTINDMIWSVFNRYKHAQKLMEAGLIGLTGSKQKVKELTDIYEDEKLSTYLMNIYKNNKDNLSRISDLTDYFEQQPNRNLIDYIERRILIDTLKKENYLESRSYYKDEVLADFTLAAEMEKEDILALLELSQRQSFDLLSSYVLFILKDNAVMFKKHDIPFDKKPKELAIFYNKLKALSNMISSNNTIEDPLLLHQTDIRYINSNQATNNAQNYLIADDLLIKIAYHLRGNFKLLSELLFEVNMNNKKAGYFKIHGNVMEDAVFLYDCNNQVFDKIYFKDVTLNKKEDIENYLDNFKGEKAVC